MAKFIQRGQTESGGTIFELEYAPPFGGIDSSAAPPYINPANFIDLNGMIVVDNRLVPIGLVSLGVTGTYVAIGTPNPIGPPPLAAKGIIDFGAYPSLYEVIVAGTEQNTGATVSVSKLNLLDHTSTYLGSAPFKSSFPGSGPNGGLTYKIIANNCYFTFKGADSIFKLTWDGTLSVLTNYVGGAFLTELNGRLVLGYTTKTLGGVTTDYPYQIAWSAPAGNYSEWNPLDGSNLITGAGYNNLPDVEDTITGMWAIGPDIYVLRSQGVSEITPLNSGIQPFDFNHLWASHKGIGSKFSDSLSQYGSVAMFVSETDIISMGYQGIMSVTASAKAFIYKTLAINTTPLLPNALPPIKSAMSPLTINNNTFLVYVLNNSNNFMFLDVEAKQWYALKNVALAGIEPQLIVTSFSGAISTLVIATNSYSGNVGRTLTRNFYYLDVQNIINVGTLITNVNDVAFLSDITIDSIGLYVESVLGGTITFSVNNIIYGPLTIAPGAVSGYYKVYPPTGLLFTGRSPQLTLTATAGMNISKFSLFGSFDTAQKYI